MSLRNVPNVIIGAVCLLLLACGNVANLTGSDAGQCDGGACGCTLDVQCSGATPRCDRNTGTCVACLPLGDNCPPGQRCVAQGASFACSATCTKDADCPKSDGGAPLSCCSGACLDTSADTRNCGACGKSCPVPAHAAAACAGGACGLGPCEAGHLDCDALPANGCEIDATVDARNCGVCGKACMGGRNQSAACVAGACTTTCAMGFAHCSMDPLDGCEADILGDVKSCGGCGKPCGVVPNGAPACKAGMCSVGACNPGFGDCNQLAADGCEASVLGDVANCGACGKVCMVPNASASCANGVCGLAMCSAGFANCDALPGNGCEVAVASDAKNCGACGRACGGANSMQICQAGMCAINACSPGFADCDAMPQTGCEVPIASDVANCGGCGMACPMVAHGVASCANAQCGIGMCNFGFADCNRTAKDGCEADLLGPQNCGLCGNACPVPANATAGCGGGVCGIGMCNAGFGNCDNNPANGCERSVVADVANCGACGKVCVYANGQPACLNGQCGLLACNVGFGDCDKNPANGCEVATTSDVKNCGGCGVACAANQVCNAGVCRNISKILLIHSEVTTPANAVDVQTRLLATGAFNAVDLFNASAATPTVQAMQAYDSVLVWSNDPPLNSIALGDNLATYFDGGGAVVVAVFAIGGVPAGLLGGRFGIAANGYILMAPTGPSAANTPASLGAVAEPNSPLMVGVKTLTATSARRGPGAVVNGGLTVASWNDGTPLIIRGVAKGRNRVDLNMWPVSAPQSMNSWTGDGITILRNALIYR